MSRTGAVARVSPREALCALLRKQVGRGYPGSRTRGVWGVFAAFSSGCARSKMAQDKDPLSVYAAGLAQSPATRVFSDCWHCYRFLKISEIPPSKHRQPPLLQQIFRYLKRS